MSDTTFGAIFNAELPGSTRFELLRAYDEGDLSATETVSVARTLDRPGNADVLESIRSLNVVQQRRAIELVADAGDDGADLLSTLDP